MWSQEELFSSRCSKNKNSTNVSFTKAPLCSRDFLRPHRRFNTSSSILLIEFWRKGSWLKSHHTSFQCCAYSAWMCYCSSSYSKHNHSVIFWPRSFSCRQFIEEMLSLLMCILTSAPIKPISKNNFHKPVKGRQSAIIVECDAHYIVCSSLQSKQLPGTG